MWKQRVMVPRTVDALAEHKVNRASVRKMLSKHDAARNNTTLRRHFVYVITKYLEGKHNSRLEMLLWTYICTYVLPRPKYPTMFRVPSSSLYVIPFSKNKRIRRKEARIR